MTDNAVVLGCFLFCLQSKCDGQRGDPGRPDRNGVRGVLQEGEGEASAQREHGAAR